MTKAPSVRSSDVLRLAAEAHRDPSTVLRVIRGDGNRLSREAVQDAAKKLGVKLPSRATDEDDDED